MKQKNIAAFASLLSLFLLVACQNDSGNKSDTEDPISASQGSSFSDDVVNDELTEEMLREASDGIAVESQMIRSTTTDNGEIQIVMYNSTYLDYETTLDEYSYRLYSDHYDDGQYKVTDPIPYDKIQPNRNNISLMRDYVSDSQGMLLDKRITADNQIRKTYGRVDGSTNDKVGISFVQSGFYNFFYSLTATDFVKGDKKNTFVLDRENMQEPDSLVYTTSALTAGASESVLEEFTLTTDGKHITGYEAKMEPVVNDDLVPGYIYTMNLTVRGTIVGLGKNNSLVNAHFLKEKEGEGFSELDSLFASLRNGNYTERVSYSSRDDEGDFSSKHVATYEKTSDSMVVKDSEGTVTEAYYVTEEGKKQKLRQKNESYYFDGKPVVNDIVEPTFSLDSRFFTKKNDSYVFSMEDSGLITLQEKDFTSASLTGTIVEMNIEVEEGSVSFTIRGRDSMSSGFTITSVFTDIGTTDNGIVPSKVKSMDDMTWKELLSSQDYETATQYLSETGLDKVPTLKNGYADVSASVVSSSLRFEYALGNWFELFDEDHNQIPSKAENEKYYDFRDALYSDYEKALKAHGFVDLTESKENGRIISLTSTVTLQSKQYQCNVQILEKTITERDLLFRISFTEA